MSTLTSSILQYLERHGLASARDLQQVLQVSQPTLSRKLRSLGTRICRIGKGRSTRYTLADQFPTGERQVPLYSINHKGRAEEIARLHAIRNAGHSGYWVETDACRPWLLGIHPQGVFDDIPYYLQDIRPQGYLGRIIAKRLSQQGYTGNPDHWSQRQIMMYLMNYGTDLPGSLLIGETALERAATFTAVRVTKGHENEQYPKLAARQLDEDIGSSAGGERPKFTVFVEDPAGNDSYHAIVKFSPSMNTPSGTRWADLLVAEHIALQLLNEAGYDATETRILCAGNRTFLEARRFDRIGTKGRVMVVSLQAVDMEYAGQQNWTRTAQALEDQGAISADDAQSIRSLDHFGLLIANTDRHAGNISLFPVSEAHRPAWRLAPAYDMLPMFYAPIDEEIRTREWNPVIPINTDTGIVEMAHEYWQRIAQDTRVSEAFRRIANGHARQFSKL